MKSHVTTLVRHALDSLDLAGASAGESAIDPHVERTRDPRHGDFTTNVAMRLAKPLGRRPRELAEALVAALPASEQIAAVEIAGPGFINFTLSEAAGRSQIAEILDRGQAYGCSDIGKGTKVLLEFVSANPTGPLHVGHGRHAAYGATLGNLLSATGHQVHREYYVNDAGRQMEILAISVWVRYLQAQGVDVAMPANGYRGDYVRDIATTVSAAYGERFRVSAEDFRDGLPPDAPDGGDQESYVDAVVGRARELLGEDGFREIFDQGLNAVLDDIRDDLEAFGVSYDRWYSERSLTTHGTIDTALEQLTARDRLYVQDGATWFRASEYGDEKDRVVIRENGVRTYFASDIAYHHEKRTRGFDLLLDVLGADHHGYIARVRAGLEAMGEDPESLEVRLVQFVTLYRGGEKVQMSTRSGEFVTLRELREEVGRDAARLFYVMRSNDQHLEFDLELAKSSSSDNPVYYIQYAHARVCSVMQQLAERGQAWDREQGLAALERVEEPQAKALIRALSRYPEVLELAALNRAPQTLVFYLRDLAHDFHTWYNAQPFLVDDAVLRDARLTLCVAARQVIVNGLTLLGVSAPERM
ncbi:MAG: arginine--tRNA ligase [Gammaproteobacteria bacterium]|nr:MAG: arginine--tRNA ligase [Gammaproteobacteria bacterium]